MLETKTITYRDGETHLTGFLAADPAAGQRPGVLVVHGGAGLDDHAKGRARRLAALGLVAFACDMYGEGVMGNRERVMGCISQFRNDPPSLIRHWSQIVASDFFTIEVWTSTGLKRFIVLFFIDLSTRRVE